jgi:hypothetical protein
MIDTANTVTPPQKVLIIDDEPTIREAMRYGAVDLVSKPFGLVEFRQTVKINIDHTNLVRDREAALEAVDSLQTGLHHGNCVEEITEQQQQSLDLCYDLVNSLTSVCVPQQLLPEHLDGNSAHDPRRLSKLTRTGVEQIERCLEVIRKFYDNSSEHLMQDLKPTALDAVVGEVADACRLKTTRRYAGIQLDVDIEPCKGDVGYRRPTRDWLQDGGRSRRGDVSRQRLRHRLSAGDRHFPPVLHNQTGPLCRAWIVHC